MRNQRSKWDAFLEALLPGETPVTFLMMLFCVGTYLLGALQTHLLWESDGAALLRMGANFGPQTMAGGEWWRLATYAFLHGGIIHLAFNMMALRTWGRLSRCGSGPPGSALSMQSLRSRAALAHFSRVPPSRLVQAVPSQASSVLASSSAT